MQEVFQLAQQKFKPYIKLMYPKYQFGAMHHLLAETLDLALKRTSGYTRIAISMPPRHGKSLTISELFPGYALGVASALGKEEHIMAVSYAASLANDFGWSVRRSMKTNMYNAIFPAGGLAGDKGRSGAIFRTPADCSYRSFGVGGALTGKPATILIVDDPIKNREQADSKAWIAKLQNSFGADAYSRLEPGAIVIIVHTRWSEQDLIGYVLKTYTGDNWHYIRLPALCDSEDDMLGRQIGDALVPFRYDEEALLKIKANQSVRDWAALYQNDPIAGAGSFWKPHYLNKSVLPDMRELEFVFASWDCANELSDDADYTACTIWGIKDLRLYCLTAYRRKADFDGLLKFFHAVDEEWSPNFHLIEKAANGVALGQFMEANEPGLNIEFCTAHRNKGLEFNIASAAWKNQLVIYDESMSGCMTDLIGEISQWPGVYNDDLAISNLHAVRWFQQNWNSGSASSVILSKYRNKRSKAYSLRSSSLLRKQKRTSVFGRL